MTLRGTVHGDMIKLERVSGLPEGQQVTVSLEPTQTLSPAERLESLKRAFGGWSDDPEGVDEFLKQVRRDRDLPSRPTGLEE